MYKISGDYQQIMDDLDPDGDSNIKMEELKGLPIKGNVKKVFCTFKASRTSEITPLFHASIYCLK